jgi:hypothetical protein
MMAPIPPSIAQNPAKSAGAIDGSNEKMTEADPLTFLANISEKVLGTTKETASKSNPTPLSGRNESVETFGREPAESLACTASSLSKKEKQGKKTSKIKKATTNKKRKRGKEEHEDERLSPLRQRPPVAQVVIHNTDDNSLHQEAGTLASTLQDEYTEHFMAAHASLSGQSLQQQQPTPAQLQQELSMKERMMLMMIMENPSMSRIRDNFLSRHYASLEHEELELAVLRRHEKFLLNISTDAEGLMRNSVADRNFNHLSLLGMGAGIGNGTNFDLATIAALGGPNIMPAAGRSSATAFSPAFMQNSYGDGSALRSAVAAATASMGCQSASLMNGLGNSTLLRALSAQNTFPNFRYSTMTAPATGFAAGALGTSSDPAMAMFTTVGVAEAPTSLQTTSVAKEEPDAKRLAPARGVFDTNTMSDDDVIDSLARANARFYKNDTNKSGNQRFRGYQCEQWTQKYQDLLEFNAENGNW